MFRNNILTRLSSRLLNLQIFSSVREAFLDDRKSLILIEIVVPIIFSLIIGREYIFMYYYMEIVIMGFYAGLRILFSRSRKLKTRITELVIFNMILGFMNFIYGIFAIVFSLFFFSSATFEVAWGAESEINSELWNILSNFLRTELLEYTLVLFIFFGIDFIWNYLLKKEERNIRAEEIFDEFTQGRVVIFHITLIASGFIIGIPSQFINGLSYGFYQLTGSGILFEITVRLSNAVAAGIFGLISVWNRGRMKKVYGPRDMKDIEEEKKEPESEFNEDIPSSQLSITSDNN